MSIDIPTTTKKAKIGRLTATLISDLIDGEALDTRVEIEKGCICFVGGPDRDKFIEELNQVIEKYEI